MAQTSKPIYKSGQYIVLPLTAIFVVRDASGREMYRTTEGAEDAIDAADDMAQLDLAA